MKCRDRDEQGTFGELERWGEGETFRKIFQEEEVEFQKMNRKQ